MIGPGAPGPSPVPIQPATPDSGSSNDAWIFARPCNNRTCEVSSPLRTWKLQELPSSQFGGHLCEAVVGAGRSAVSRIWVVALGVVALVASCTSGSSAGPGAGAPAATRPPVPTGSAGRVCTPG